MIRAFERTVIAKLSATQITVEGGGCDSIGQKNKVILLAPDLSGFNPISVSYTPSNAA